MAKTITVQYLNDSIERLKKIEKGDWIDLRAAYDYTIKKGEFTLIHLGVAMKLPDGYEAHVVSRSSTSKNFGIILVNGVGIIDNSYRGNDDIWMFPALCMKKHGTVIHKGDRICQFRIVKKQPEIKFIEVERLNGKNRGGIGSTGKE